MPLYMMFLSLLLTFILAPVVPFLTIILPLRITYGTSQCCFSLRDEQNGLLSLRLVSTTLQVSRVTRANVTFFWLREIVVNFEILLLGKT